MGHGPSVVDGAAESEVPLEVIGDHGELVRRFAAYGHSHGAWDGDAGHREGSLARIIEAARGQTPVLPSVKSGAGFLCGTEFATMADEVAFFAARGLRLDTVCD